MTQENRATDGCRHVSAVLLAAGFGTRLRPLTDHVPKCLVPIAGRPLLDYWFDRLEEAGIRDVLINTHHHADQVEAHVARVSARGPLSVVTTHEPKLLGSAGTVTANRDFVQSGDDCLIIYADNLSDVDLAALVAAHRAHDDPITMTLFHAPRPEQCGIAQLDGSARIVGFVEKPTNPTSDLANAGVYALAGTAFHEIADMNAFDLATDAIAAFIGRMRGWIWEGYHRDMGTHEALRQAEIDARRVFGPKTGAQA